MSKKNASNPKKSNEIFVMIKPTLILCIICAVISGLLVLAYNLTYVDTSGVMTFALKKSSKGIYPEGDFTLITKIEVVDGEEKNVSLTYGEMVKNVIKENNSGHFLFEVVADGYNKKGIDILVEIDENGEVFNISPVLVTDIPGGNKVKSPEFLSSFVGISDSQKALEVDAITATTMSSEGIKNAVFEALQVYNENKDEIEILAEKSYQNAKGDALNE